MTQTSRITALKFGSGAIIAFGIITLLSLVSPLSAVMGLFLDLAIWPPADGAYDLISPSARLLTAIVAGLTVGLGIMLYLLATTVYPSDAKLGGRIMLAGIASWFVVDSLGSILSSSGGWFNVILNLTFLLLIALPILWPAQEQQTV
ncbi:MAG: hypothetical protein OXR62_07840 [Ahrensia sp.]|nr:hypothetical protein [Ahrensia sp.]